jgi:hypothetical protein
MRASMYPARLIVLLVAAAAVATAPSVALRAFEPAQKDSQSQKDNQKDNQKKKPSINLRANPTTGMTPLRVVVTAELRGGSNDYEEFYCADIEWDWGDGTKSEQKGDCEPYEAGKSEITRRYTTEHMFRSTGFSNSPFGTSSAAADASGSQPQTVEYRVKFILKQKGKTVGAGQTTIQIRQGIAGN